MRYICEPGDWVRFYRDARLVIGCIEYVTAPDVLGYRHYHTDMGSVREDCVLEFRQRPRGEEAERRGTGPSTILVS